MLSRLPGTVGRASAVASLLTLLVATAASAHPFFRDGEAPVRSLATITLDLAHGCTADGGHDQDAQSATTAVAVELADAVTFAEPHPSDGWVVEVEQADDRVEVVTWTADGGAEPAPAFDLDVVLEGDEGDDIWFRVVQSCDEQVHRWVGTPDRPADEPAVSLALTAPDPDRPPPGPQDQHDAMEETKEEPPMDASEDPDDAPDDPPGDDPVVAAEPDDGAAPVGLIAVAAVLLGGGAWLLFRRGRRDAP